MPQEPPLTHCLETTALSLLLQNQALGVCGFLVTVSTSSQPLSALHSHPQLPTPSPWIQEPGGPLSSYESSRPATDLAEPVTHLLPSFKRSIQDSTLPPRSSKAL
ncbi:unnamed protein product [Rangifer tarandus platyrhynchus]|uniref:Uncharacterized protein n=1 Tax=Rangifer tarandus platyrhynchus TaxID=3082113 RepID=A0ABN9A487_RANTA|nr:unnamed protein product [Rangifer tarandus platyrhynchus]